MIPTTIRRALNPHRPISRLALKAGLVALVLLAVAYPRPQLLLKNIARWRDLNSVVNPLSPALEPLAAELAPQLEGIERGSRALEVVQNYVLRKIPYAWDWDTWGVLDYVPTVEETLAKGREDCDGRAVVAASLLRRFGYDARLTSDLSHVWVWTPDGETMTPVRTRSGGTLITASIGGGTRVDWATALNLATLLMDLPTSIAYGIAVFPAWREALVVLAVCLVLAGRDARPRQELIGAAAIVAGWWVLRWTCGNAWDRSVLGAWGGYLLIIAGLFTMARGAAPRGAGSGEASPLPVR